MTMKPHPVSREDRQGTICEDYELNGCSVDGCPERCYLALPNPDEPLTTAEFLFVSALCQFYNPYPGPIAWFCRLAWITYQTGSELDVDQAIAEHGAWLNRPENANTRTNLLNNIRWLRHMAAKPPLWPLPDQSAFDASQWLNTGHGSYATAAGTQPNDGKTPHNPRWTFNGPGSFTVQAIPADLTVKCELWRDDPGEPEPRQPVKWDGRPIPGRCTIAGCEYQATSMSGYWDGGAPGVGTWRQQGRCPQHETGTQLADLRQELEP